MCAFRIANLFSRPVIAKNPEPAGKIPIRNNSPIEEKRTAASVHVNGQLDGDSTKNIKNEIATQPLPKNSGTESENFKIPIRFNTNDEKSLQKNESENFKIPIRFNTNDEKSLQKNDPAREINTIQNESEADSINSRSDPYKYEELWEAVPEQGKALGKTYNLNECEMAAIHCYTGEDYVKINSQLRALNGKDVDFYKADSLHSFGVDRHLSEIISDLANGLRKLPPAQSDSNIFRGLGRDVNLPPDVLDSIKEGKIISDLMFTSTTETMEQMVDRDWWHKCDHALIIHQRKNGNGRDISAFSEFKKESEILFLPKTNFKVTARIDNAEVGEGVDWIDLKNKLIKTFFEEFPKASVDNLTGFDFGTIINSLGESYPLNLKSAKELMEETLQEKFSVDLETLQQKIGKLHSDAYGGAINPDIKFKKTIITLEEISPDDELKINSEKSLATSEKQMISKTPTNTPHTAESEIPVSGQSIKPAKKQRKNLVSDQSKTTAQSNGGIKPSRTNKEENKSNFRNDDYSISDASNYGEYFPGFRE